MTFVVTVYLKPRVYYRLFSDQVEVVFETRKSLPPSWRHPRLVSNGCSNVSERKFHQSEYVDVMLQTVTSSPQKGLVKAIEKGPVKATKMA